MSQVDVSTAIYTKMTSVQTGGSFYALVGGRIYFAQARDEITIPCAIVTIVSDVPDEYFAGSDLDANYQVEIYSPRTSTPETAQAIADALYSLMHRTAITISNHTAGQTWCVDKGAPFPDDDSYGINTQWRIFATAT